MHKYVTLVGTTLTEQTSRAKLPWTFIVLDTDGVNAFAAPGGFVHITRGALALIKTEAELAGVLGHEIAHVVAEAHRERHSKEQRRTDWNGRDLVESRRVPRRARESRLRHGARELVRSRRRARRRQGRHSPRAEGGLRRHRPVRVPRRGSPSATRRQAEKNGLFASHPETQERIAKVKQLAGIEAWRRRCGTLHVDHQVSADRRSPALRRSSRGPPGWPAATAASRRPKRKRQKKRKRALVSATSRSRRPRARTNSRSPASGGARGVGADRLAKGGDNPNPVKVAISPASRPPSGRGSPSSACRSA